MWRKLGDKQPKIKFPVLVYRPMFFDYLYNVCIYDGYYWRVIGVSGITPVFRFRAWGNDYWIYVDECVPVPEMGEY